MPPVETSPIAHAAPPLIRLCSVFKRLLILQLHGAPWGAPLSSDKHDLNDNFLQVHIDILLTCFVFCWQVLSSLCLSLHVGSIIMYGALLLFESEFVHIVAISFTSLILTELLMVALTIQSWHWLMIVAELLSLSCYIASLVFLHEFIGNSFVFFKTCPIKRFAKLNPVPVVIVNMTLFFFLRISITFLLPS